MPQIFQDLKSSLIKVFNRFPIAAIALLLYKLLLHKTHKRIRHVRNIFYLHYTGFDQLRYVRLVASSLWYLIRFCYMQTYLSQDISALCGTYVSATLLSRNINRKLTYWTLNSANMIVPKLRIKVFAMLEIQLFFAIWELGYCHTIWDLYFCCVSFVTSISATSLLDKFSFRAYTYSDNIVTMRYHRLTG